MRISSISRTMAPIVNARHLFKSSPTGYPVPGETTVHDTSAVIDLENEPLHGGFLAKTLVLSIDPYMRGRMKVNAATGKSGFAVGEPLVNFGVAKILRSENPALKIRAEPHRSAFAEYFVSRNASAFEVIDSGSGIPSSAYVGVLGMPGKTAYYGWNEFAKAKKGEKVFVTTGAGPVGSFVVQLAKREGLRVIASAGSDEKVEFLRKIGVDVAFNYKTQSTAEVLQREYPIDIYWDNVGGETLDIALANANGNGTARFISEPYALKNVYLILSKEISMFGFWVGRHEAKYGAEFRRVVPQFVKGGDIQYLEDKSYGLETAGQGILDVLQGMFFCMCVGMACICTRVYHQSS
ncbi:NAD-P-binding protein [Artomyces pyxidatus]|uniref:NAD-P-binding protein n=1 Tax=Artomyces pyxidatus TaxID=48021 RepID=A0ACB8SJW4_9AGAM|nr:NAD-P-binding protein [Artomyces pyxidatus]